MGSLMPLVTFSDRERFTLMMNNEDREKSGEGEVAIPTDDLFLPAPKIKNFNDIYAAL